MTEAWTAAGCVGTSRAHVSEWVRKDTAGRLVLTLWLQSPKLPLHIAVPGGFVITPREADGQESVVRARKLGDWNAALRVAAQSGSVVTVLGIGWKRDAHARYVTEQVAVPIYLRSMKAGFADNGRILLSDLSACGAAS